MRQFLNLDTLAYIFLILFGLFFRLVDHPANFTPLIAVALYAGIKFKNKSLALALPLIIMFISDLKLGFYPGFEFVYLGLVLSALVGAIKLKSNLEFVFKFFSGTFIFFVISNFGVWLKANIYAQNFAGLVKCYTMALPYYKNTLVTSFVFLVLFFVLDLLLLGNKSIVAKESYGRQKR